MGKKWRNGLNLLHFFSLQGKDREGEREAERQTELGGPNRSKGKMVNVGVVSTAVSARTDLSTQSRPGHLSTDRTGKQGNRYRGQLKCTDQQSEQWKCMRGQLPTLLHLFLSGWEREGEGRKGKREGERERGGRNRDRQTDRQKDRDRQTDRQTDREKQKEREKKRERETDRQTDRQTETDTDRDRQTD